MQHAHCSTCACGRKAQRATATRPTCRRSRHHCRRRRPTHCHLPKLPQAPPDAILSASEGFEASTNPNKLNLGVGAYRTEVGAQPFLIASVPARRWCDSGATLGWCFCEADACNTSGASLLSPCPGWQPGRGQRAAPVRSATRASPLLQPVGFGQGCASPPPPPRAAAPSVHAFTLNPVGASVGGLRRASPWCLAWSRRRSAASWRTPAKTT